MLNHAAQNANPWDRIQGELGDLHWDDNSLDSKWLLEVEDYSFESQSQPDENECKNRKD